MRCIIFVKHLKACVTFSDFRGVCVTRKFLFEKKMWFVLIEFVTIESDYDSGLRFVSRIIWRWTVTVLNLGLFQVSTRGAWLGMDFPEPPGPPGGALSGAIHHWFIFLDLIFNFNC